MSSQTKSFLKGILCGAIAFALGLLVGVYALNAIKGGKKFGDVPLQYDKQYIGADVVIAGAQGGAVNNLKTAPYPGGTETVRISSNGSGTFSQIINSGILTVGNSSANAQINNEWFATSTALNGTSTSFNLGPYIAPTSTTSTVIGVSGLPASTFVVGDMCAVTPNITSTIAFGMDCWVSSAATTTASTTVTYWNGSSSVMIVPTSTVITIELKHPQI